MLQCCIRTRCSLAYPDVCSRPRCMYLARQIDDLYLTSVTRKGRKDTVCGNPAPEIRRLASYCCLFSATHSNSLTGHPDDHECRLVFENKCILNCFFSTGERYSRVPGYKRCFSFPLSSLFFSLRLFCVSCCDRHRTFFLGSKIIDSKHVEETD
jgi:hypothetical protein